MNKVKKPEPTENNIYEDLLSTPNVIVGGEESIIIKRQQAEIERLKETLYYECPDKYPDNCEVCKGTNCGVKGNENIVDGIVMCDYCHAKTMSKP